MINNLNNNRMKSKPNELARGLSYVLGLTFLVLGACNPQSEKKTAPVSSEQNAETTESMERTVPKQIISLAQADSLYNNYSVRRAANIFKMENQNSSENSFQPARFMSVDIENLKEYLSYVEKRAMEGGTTIDSLRIYLGNYGNVEGKRNRKNTVFLLPAAEAEGSYGGIFIGPDGKAKLLRNHFNKKSKASLIPNFMTFVQPGGSLIMNDYGSGPPPEGDF